MNNNKNLRVIYLRKHPLVIEDNPLLEDNLLNVGLESSAFFGDVAAGPTTRTDQIMKKLEK